MPGELESECSTNAPKWPQPAVLSVSSHTTATSTKSLHSKFSKFRNQFQPNSLKWPSSKGFCPMFCLALSNKRSILVVCGNYNVSHSMLLGRVGHTRSLRWNFCDFAAPSSALSPLEGPMLACLLHHRPDCWAPKRDPKIQAKIDHRNVEIFQITVTHIGNCTNKAPHLAQLSLEMGTRS